eukprot:gnl/TRDRNA2_/TRDRNA2_38321_c1_seq1.p1 gnl/TRDRNA2_/TRDRNA2_38321_c1~~gnl/TRDRNA2_/TRDRNA2_38321_c1_seq1.p1  ORF type:complete len:221 (-),score=43.66 gnl/TRDRNA2_/TRDRNA2_38321_c1_seq1:61-639(-)
MHDVARRASQQMSTMSVAGLNFEALTNCCQKATRQCGGEAVCEVSTHLFPKGYTVAGTEECLKAFKDIAMTEGALQARMSNQKLAFHTRLMDPAATKVGKSLKGAVEGFTYPRRDLFMNVRGAVQSKGTDPRQVNMDLTAQICRPVLWQQTVEEMIKSGVTEFYECGPMKQIKAMMKRINGTAWEKTYSVPV